MRYTVVWDQSALDEYTLLWISASDRQALTAASNAIDKLLRSDPERIAVQLDEDWILIEEPLIVTFAIYPDDRLVEVLQVRRYEG